MADNRPILVIGAAGQLGAVGRTVTEKDKGRQGDILDILRRQSPFPLRVQCPTGGPGR
jgi:hypothetical protein